MKKFLAVYTGSQEAHQRSGWDAGCRYDFDNPEYR